MSARAFGFPFKISRVSSCFPFSHGMNVVLSLILMAGLLLPAVPASKSPAISSQSPPTSRQAGGALKSISHPAFQSASMVNDPSQFFPAISDSQGRSGAGEATASLGSAYVRDLPQADGSHLALVSNTPINYLAPDGSWQPIDPRFEAIEGGFVNQHNLLQISAAQTQAVLRLRNGAAGLGWEPQSLALVKPDGTNLLLAQPLAAQDSQGAQLLQDDQLLRYPGSWSKAGMVEEVRSAPGQVEQSLVFDGPPALPASAFAGENDQLVLTAWLYLLPGASLVVDGAVQQAAFTTNGPIDIRSANGDTSLVLAPPLAYEQSLSGQQAAGRYRLTPQGEGKWQVAIETPWAWWSDAQRVYPVVLDPIMYVLKPVEAASIFGNYPDLCASSVLPTDNMAPAVGVGSACLGTRALVKFTQLPTLPPGYTIDKVELAAAPVRGAYWTVNNTPTIASAEVAVWRITSAWSAGSVNWNNKPLVYPVPLDNPKYMTVFAPTLGSSLITYNATRWTIQSGSSGVFSDWLANPAQNYGLELKATDESTCTPNCSYVAVPTIADWRASDRSIIENTGDLFDITRGGGFMLLVYYTPPTLANGVPYSYDTPPVLPTGGDDYLRTFHAYDLPSIPSNWTAVGVKGIHDAVVGNVGVLQAAGNLTIRKGCSDGVSCTNVVSQGDYTQQPNYFIHRGDPLNDHVQARVQPPNLADPENSALDQYVVEAAGSQVLPGNPQFTPETVLTHTLTVSSTHILEVFDLNLVQDTRLLVQVVATATHPATGDPIDMPVEARLFAPAGAGLTLAKDKGIDVITQKVKVDNSGIWGLVLAYQGDVHPTFEDPIVVSSAPVDIHLRIVVRACAQNAIPTENGCVIVDQPTAGTPYMDVGPYRIFSKAGFNPANCTAVTTCYTQDKASDGKLYSPFIVWRDNWIGGSTSRLVSMAEGPITMFLGSTQNILIASAEAWLVRFDAGGAPVDMLQVVHGFFTSDPATGVLSPSNATYAGLPLSASDMAGAAMPINVFFQAAVGSASLDRQVETHPGTLEPFSFDILWVVLAEGYTSSLVPGISGASYPGQAEVSSLSLVFSASWSVDYDRSINPPNGLFTNLRNQAQIVQPDSLGGAFRPVQALILAPGKELPGPGSSSASCNGDCLDLRAMDDSLLTPNRSWELPDITVTGAAQSVIFSQPGELTVFSTDQPNAQQAVNVPFDFRTFSGSVSVEKGVCPVGGGTQEVTLIRGNSKIALPGLGSDTNSGTMISASFTLCETALREVSLTFQGPPEIPVGSTGLLVSKIGGQVLIGPSNTQISLTIDYHDASSIVDGSATVTINTEGLFDVQTSGKVIAVVDYSGHAWVSWNPLDVGVDLSAKYSSWLTGQVHAHLWKGQGWQHKYSWLPDNDATHFAGSISAQVRIEEGQAFSWWFIDIPPFDITFGIQVAFGQFCSNSTCTAYEWGVKGKFSVVGYDVGVYYGFSSGFHFILGSDGHVLIDQYSTDQLEAGGDPLVNGLVTAGIERRSVSVPGAPQVDESFQVSDQAGSFLVGLTWSHGAPQLSLERPDHVTINPSNAAAYGLQVYQDANVLLYGRPDPMSGSWTAHITGIQTTDDYHFIYLANKKAPDTQLLTPATPLEPQPVNTTTYPISWSVPTDLSPEVDYRISLYYTATQTAVLTDTQLVGGLIAENLPLTAGQYSWDLSSLARGVYQVYGRVYSGAPGAQAIQPLPSPYDTTQLPEEIKIVAPGSLDLSDNVAPAAPTNLDVIPLGNNLMACWDPNPEKDLSGYVLRYVAPDVQGYYITHELRVDASVPNPPTAYAPRECARIVGVYDNSLVYLEGAAYDASGNLSGFTAGNLSGGNPVEPPEAPVLTGSVQANGNINLNWTISLQQAAAASGFWLFYAREQSAGPGVPGTGATEGASPIDTGNVTNFTLSSLEAGYLYHFAVQAYDSEGRLGPLSNDLVLLITDRVDNNGDGLPDDWAAAHHITDPYGDDDRDCLNNLAEYEHLTDPQNPDTDGDGFADGEEVFGSSDPLDPSSTPLTVENVNNGLLPSPRLALDQNHLTFQSYQWGGKAVVHQIGVTNLGGGQLIPMATTSESWLVAWSVGDKVYVSVKSSGLAIGHYSGVVTVGGAPGACTLDSPQAITVDLWVASGVSPDGVILQLPLVLR